MWSVCKKELRQFFSSLTGYIAIIVFLLVNGLVLFVFEDNILDFGYATLDFSDGLNGKGFYFSNPNASRTCGCGESFAV